MDDNRKLKKASIILISVFWIVMMGWLIFSQVITKNRLTAYRPFLSKNTLISDQWLGIYFNNSPMGFVHQPALNNSLKFHAQCFRDFDVFVFAGGDLNVFNAYESVHWIGSAFP